HRLDVKHLVFLATIMVGSFGAGQVAGLVGAHGHKLVPFSVQVQALELGCVNALFAMGIVLIYRSNRIINFAHAGFGGVGAVTLVLLARRYGLSWWLVFPAGLAAAALTGALVELLLIRRFARATRLVLT